MHWARGAFSASTATRGGRETAGGAGARAGAAAAGTAIVGFVGVRVLPAVAAAVVVVAVVALLVVVVGAAEAVAQQDLVARLRLTAAANVAVRVGLRLARAVARVALRGDRLERRAAEA